MKITTHPNIEGVNWIFAKLFWVQTFKYIYIYIYVIIKELKILMGVMDSLGQRTCLRIAPSMCFSVCMFEEINREIRW